MAKTKGFRILLLCTLVLAALICGLALGALQAGAAEEISYIDSSDPNETSKTVSEYTLLTDTMTELTDGYYVVSGEVTLTARLQIKGVVHLILKDGAHLIANNGIGVNPGSTDDYQLHIYAQSESASTMGKLTAEASDRDAGIGGDYLSRYVGSIVINGGNITAEGGADGAGIGNGYVDTVLSSSVTINGGIVNAIGGANSAGIGAARGNDAKDIRIRGGSVTATGAVGIGALFGRADITITGGTVTATGNSGGAGIGCGKESYGGTVVIVGGKVIAVGAENAPGIGVAGAGKVDLIYITATDVTATGGAGADDIGSGENGTVGGTLFYNDKIIDIRGNVTLPGDFVVGADETLMICSGATLTVPEGFTLTNNGTLQNGGLLQLEGTLQNNGEAETCDGTHTYQACRCFCGHTKHQKGVYAFTNGFCPNGCYEEPERVSYFNYSYLYETHNGYYVIKNPGMLFWFAQLVNGALADGTPQNAEANAILFQNVDLGGAAWFPIGLYNDPAVSGGAPVVAQYRGHFDGNGRTVSNFVASGSGPQGLFGYCGETARITTLGVLGAEVKGSAVGAITGHGGQLLNCYAHNCTMTGDSENDTDVVIISALGANNQASARIENCYAYTCNLYLVLGEQNIVMHPIGGVMADGTVAHVQNTYYYGMSTMGDYTSTEGVTEVYQAQVESGELAYRLNNSQNAGLWKQEIGVADFPYVSSDYTGYDSVYCGYLSCADDAVAVYTNDKTVSAEKPAHVDENFDHTCDNGCGKTDVGAHADSPSDADHVCDYGCGVVLEDCSDADTNHACDACGVEMNADLHADAVDDDDHLCDYGCGAVLEACADANTNHACDICGAAVNADLHADAVDDNDHLCDYGCGAVLESCADGNKDHACDVCNAAVCADADSNHICDFCGAAVNADRHADTAGDGDHLCDYGCGALLGECTDADGDYLCDECGAELPREGLSAGAIVGIVIGSVAVVGLGGFAVFWFAIKKKGWSDLVRIFKKK